MSKMDRIKFLSNVEIDGTLSHDNIGSLDELKQAIYNNQSPIIIEKDIEIEVQDTINIPANTVIEGNNAKFIRATSFEGRMFTCDSDVVMRNIRIEGNRTAMTAPTWDKTIEIACGDRNVIENIIIENGNEAIVTYGDDSVIRHCNITNCGGNGIHFSDAPRTRVENCTIVGANKRSGMGHEGGCISWSLECQDIICENNYLEDGLAGLGYIKVEQAGNIRIVGNTVKNCTHGVHSIFQTSLPKNVVISNNHFINSGEVKVDRTDANTLGEGTWLISNNIFDGTIISLNDIYPLIIEGNIFKNITQMGTISNTRYAIVRGNTFIGGTGTSLIYLPRCHFMTIEGNTISFSADVDTTASILNFQGESIGSVVKGNVIEITGKKHTSYAIQTTGNGAIVEGNRLSLQSGKGIYLENNSNCTNNIIICANAQQEALFANGGVVNTIIANNISNGNFRIASSNVTKENNITSDFVELTPVIGTFTADGTDEVFNFDIGMTWAEFVESEYNTDGYFAIDITSDGIVYNANNGGVRHIYVRVDSIETHVNTDDAIINNAHYYDA